MTKQIINVGTTANDKKGDSLRAAFQKVNANFTELYTALGIATDLDINLGNFVFEENTVRLTNSTNDDSTATQIEIAQPVRIESNLTVGGDILPNAANGGNLGSSTNPWHSLYVSDSTIYINNIPIALDDANNLTVNGTAVNAVGSAAWSAITGKPAILTNLANNDTLTFNDGLTIANSTIGFTTSDTITQEILGGTISQTITNRSQVAIDASSIVITRNVTQVVDDGVIVATDEAGSVASIGNGTAYLKTYSEPDGPNNTQYAEVGTAGSYAYLESRQDDVAGYTLGGVVAGPGTVSITAHSTDDKTWTFDQEGILTVPESSGITGINDFNISSQSGDNSSGLFLNGNPLVGTAILYANKTAIIRSDNNGNPKDWDFDRLGTLTTPSLLPRAFTATVDADHYAGEGSLTLEGDAWYFAVEFRVNAGGGVETVITNDTPWPSNPGYTEEMPFEFTEADHGIPGYTFGLSLRNLTNPGPMMWTTNLTVTQPPVLPATIKNSEAVKLTADATSWTFSADGSLTVPGAIKQGNSKLAFNEYGDTNVYLTPTDDDSTAVYINTTSVQAYGKAVVSIRGGAGLQPALDVYLESRQQLGDMFNALQNEPGFPWGVTLPVGGDTSSQLNLLPPGTFPNQSAVVAAANSMDNAYSEYENLYNDSEVSVGVGNKNWRFDSIGHLHAPNQGQVMFYDEQGAFNGAIGGDNLGHVVFAAGSTKGIKVFTDAGVKGWTFGTNGNITLPVGGDIVDSTGTSVLGGTGADLGLLKISASTIGTKNNPDSGGWGDYSLYLDPGGESSGYIQIPSVTGQQSGGELVIANNAVNNGGIRLRVNSGDITITDAGLEVPYNHHIRQNNSWTRVTTPGVNFDQLGTIVWTSTVDYISSAKLVIQVEADEAQDATGWHSQACEAIIACRGYASGAGGPTGDPQMIVYGVVHTSVNPLVTFTVRRNSGSGLVEVIGTLTATAASAANLRIHSVEMSTRD